MTPELKRALRQLSMTLPEAEAFVRLRNGRKWRPSELDPWVEKAFGSMIVWSLKRGWYLTPQGRFVAEALVRLGVGRKG